MYYRIWFRLYKNNRVVGSGLWHQYYEYKGNATRAAKRYFNKRRVDERTGDVYTYDWKVSQTNPWRTQPEQTSFMN